MPVRTLAAWLCLFAALTSSFDIFLAFNVGFNFKASQICIVFSLAVLTPLVIKNKKIILPVGYKYLLAWTMLAVIFIPNTGFIQRNVGYTLWLFFNILTLLVFINTFTTISTAVSLYKRYLTCFVLIAIFGLLQLFLGFIGISPPLVEQWWIPGVFPRINGFSYEPSYFATYILMGWVMAMYLLERKTEIISYRFIVISVVLLSSALILCGSRIGWIFMAVWIFRYPCLFVFRISKRKINKFYSMAIALFILFFVVGIGIATTRFSSQELSILLSGTGVAGASDHSTSGRSDRANDTLNIALKNPIIGVGLGGVASEIAFEHGVEVNSVETAKEWEGMNVLFEISAATGLFGVVAFLLFLSKNSLSIIKKIDAFPSQIRPIVISLIYALIFEFFALCLNQNILRIYFWVHLSVLGVFVSVFLKTFSIGWRTVDVKQAVNPI